MISLLEPGHTGARCHLGILMHGASQNAPNGPQDPPGTLQELPGTPRKGGGVCYLDSPSLNVALRELGFTFLALFMWVFKTPVSETPMREGEYAILTRPH